MTAAPIPLTDAIPLMQVGGTTGQNNAKDFRRGLLASLFTTTGIGTAREGVISQTATGAQASEFQSLLVYELATPGLGVRINAGSCIINRTGEGPYLAWMETAISTLDLAPAHATQARWDTVVVRLADKNISADAAGSLHGAYFDIISGALGTSLVYFGTNPGAPGEAPIIPNGCIALADIARVPGSAGDTITDSDIVLRREGTSVNGTPRWALENSDVGVAGTNPGEMRAWHSHYDGVDGPVISLWDGAEWRGMRSYARTQRLIHGFLSSDPSGETIGYIDLESVTNLGVRYMAFISVTTVIEFDGSLGSVLDDQIDVVIRVDNETTGDVYAIGNARNWSGGSGSRLQVVSGSIIIPEILTGARIWLRMENPFGTGSASIYAFTSPSEPYETRISYILVPL